jgi:hypothetical protein
MTTVLMAVILLTCRGCVIVYCARKILPPFVLLAQ